MTRTRACVNCGGHHEHGEAIREQDHELPQGDLTRPGDGRSVEQIAAEWSAAIEDVQRRNPVRGDSSEPLEREPQDRIDADSDSDWLAGVAEDRAERGCRRFE